MGHVIKKSVFVLAIISVSAFMAEAKIIDEIKKSFDVTAEPSLSIENVNGSLTIKDITWRNEH